jgi:hypothetical protein
VYFHGSRHVFQPGDLVLPGSEVGDNRGFSQGDDRNKVYVFSAANEVEGAESHGRWGFTQDGFIYLVEPIGPVEPDPADRFSGDKWCCGSATVLKRVWPKGPPATALIPPEREG